MINYPTIRRPVWTLEGEATTTFAEVSGMRGALTFFDLHRRTRRVCGLTRLTHRIVGVFCPWCEQPALQRVSGSDTVDCAACGKEIDERHYNWLTRTLADQERRRLRQESKKSSTPAA